MYIYFYSWLNGAPLFFSITKTNIRYRANKHLKFLFSCIDFSIHILCVCIVEKRYEVFRRCIMVNKNDHRTFIELPFFCFSPLKNTVGCDKNSSFLLPGKMWNFSISTHTHVKTDILISPLILYNTVVSYDQIA